MFIITNYLDVEAESRRTDGFVVEECGDYVPELAGYVIVCREHRVSTILEWAQNNMGDKYKLFEKQFGMNKQKAMMFIRIKGGIKSFTEEFMMQAGGLEQFKELYCKEEPKPEPEPEPEPIPELEPEPTEPEPEPVEPAEPEPEPEPVEPIESVELAEPEPVPTEIIRENLLGNAGCHNGCIFNSDGTFKGFTEGQIVSLLRQLRELDNRIAMDTLHPDYILTKQELEESIDVLDKVSPSLYKAFILSEAQNATDEIDRIRTSVMLDKFSSFITTLNR